MAWYTRRAQAGRLPRGHAGTAVLALLVGQHTELDLHRMFLVRGSGDKQVKGRTILRRYARWLRALPDAGDGAGTGAAEGDVTAAADHAWLRMQLLAMGAVTSPAFTPEEALRWAEGVAAFPVRHLRVHDVFLTSNGPLAAMLHDAVLETALARGHTATWTTPMTVTDPAVTRRCGLTPWKMARGVPGLFLWAGDAGDVTVTVAPTPVDATLVDERVRLLQAAVVNLVEAPSTGMTPLLVAVDITWPSMMLSMVSPLRGGGAHWTPHAVALTKHQLRADPALHQRFADTMREVLTRLPSSASVDATKDAERLLAVEYVRVRAVEAASLLGLTSILAGGLNLPGEVLYRHELGTVHDAVRSHKALHMAGSGVHGSTQFPTQLLAGCVRGVSRRRAAPDGAAPDGAAAKVEEEEEQQGVVGGKVEEEGADQGFAAAGDKAPAPHTFVELSPHDVRVHAQLHVCGGNRVGAMCDGKCVPCTLFVDAAGNLVDAAAGV